MFTQEELDHIREDVNELIFNAECVIFRYDHTQESVNENTLQHDRGDKIWVYGHPFEPKPCHMQPSTRTYERPHEWGQERRMVRTYVLRLPFDANEPRPFDIVNIVNSMDPKLAPEDEYKVLDPQTNTNPSMRIIILERIM